MDENIQKLLKGVEFRPPATNDMIDKFEEASNIKLPDEYKDFLKLTNGGEGFIGENSYVMLWAVEELIELNESYEVNDYAPGLFVFGSNGGGEAYAFNTRSNSMDIVQVPFVGMDLELVQQKAKTFNEFIENLYRT